jgi:hypothetical protein
MEYDDQTGDCSRQLKQLVMAMIAVAVVLPLAYRVAAGPAPSWGCYDKVPPGTDAYLLHTKLLYTAAGVVLAGLLLVLSTKRRRLDGPSTAAPGAGTAIGVAVAGVLTLMSYAEPGFFVLYFLAAAALASWIVAIAILILAARTASRAHRSASIAPWYRWSQLVGWYLLAVVLPVAFVFAAPIGPICIE